MTSPQHTVIVEQASSIEEDAGSIYQFMHGVRLAMDYYPSASDVSQALKHSRTVKDLLLVNLEKVDQLIIELERCQNFA